MPSTHVFSINGAVEGKRRFAVLQKRQNIVGNLLRGGCLSKAPMEKDKEAVASRGLFKVPGNPTALFKKVKSQRSLKKELQESSTTTTSTATTTTINETPPPEEEPKKKRKKRFLFKGLLKGSGMSREERKALKKKRKKEGDAQGEDSGSPEDSAGVEGEDEEEITTRVPRAPPTPQKG